MSDHPDLSPLVIEDLEPRRVPVPGLYGSNYVLIEASADAGVKYRSAAARAAIMRDGEVVGVANVGDIEPLILSLCLREIKAGPGGAEREVLVPEQRIRTWPDRVQGALFERLKAISPTLAGEETEESLLKTVARANKALAKLRSRRLSLQNGDASSSQEGAEGGAPDPTQASSASASN